MSDDKEFFERAANYAKEFENFPEVHMAVSLHPEWLTLIPEGRKWAILHQVIFSGVVTNLDLLLALQKPNKSFRLLTNTKDNETIFDIAALRQDVPEMSQRLHKLAKLDELLTYARACNWDECYAILKENPTYVNEKPPYRLYYVIHHMACANASKAFDRLRQIENCVFDLTLRADRKKVNEIARMHGAFEFAEYMERTCPNLLNADTTGPNGMYEVPEEARKRTKKINSIMEHKCIVKDLDVNFMSAPTKQMNRTQTMSHLSSLKAQAKIETTVTTTASSTTKEEKDKKNDEMMLDNLTCPLTLAVFVDPVIAADGFTYERSAIEAWLKKNDRSPMTNQILPNKSLNANTVIKEIIQALKLSS